MRKWKFWSIFLVIAMLLPMLIACGRGGGDETTKHPSDGETTAGSTTGGAGAPTSGAGTSSSGAEGFDNEQLIINVSVAVNTEQTFGAADIYSRGPEKYSDAADEVQRKVYNRNRKVADDLDLQITWQETNELVGHSQAVLDKLVQNNPPNSPDIFINDIYDITHSMLNGSLKNLVGGEGNFLNFDDEGWYKGYMEGTTITQDKMYILAGDYFIDILRNAFVVYINRDVFDQRVPASEGTVSDFYEYVDAGFWDYEYMRYIIGTVADIAGGSVPRDEDENDNCIGMIATLHFERAMTWTSGLSIVEWKDEKGKVDPDLKFKGTPSIITDNSQFETLYENFGSVFTQEGTFFWALEGAEQQRSVVLFLTGRALFLMTMLGEMESPAVRESSISRGVLPLPKYDYEAQENYYTLVHDQAEVGCILANTRNFSAATAYMQAANTASEDIMLEYFEQSLKLRYNEDKDTQAMLNLIRAGITDPFESLIARLVVSGGQYLPGAPATGTEIYKIIADDFKGTPKNTFTSTWDSQSGGWVKNLAVLIDIFEKLT